MKAKFYELPEKYKYSMAFESKVISLDDEKASKYLSLASEDSLKKYLPKNIDFKEKIDCLAIAGQSFLANKLNLNDDSVDSETAIRIAELFSYSYIDLNHNRSDIIGVILNASYTDLDTNKELTKEDVQNYKKPFAVTIGGIIWKLANKKITAALEDDKTRNSLYFSWEVGFSDYKLVEIPKNKFDLSESIAVYSTEKIKEYDKQLKANGGSGQLENGNKIGRVIVGDCIPLGVGIVENPAGQLDPLVIDDKEEVKADLELETKLNINDVDVKAGIERVVLDTIAQQSKLGGLLYNISNISEQNFTNNKESVIKIKSNINIMDKLTKITDLNDENMKECKASAVIDLWNEELKKADVAFKLEQEKAKNAEAEKIKVEANLAKIQEDLKKLQDIAAAKEAEETFNQRMTYFDDTYELSKEERQTIASEVKDADSVTFEKAKSKYDIFLKDKSKANIQAKLELEEAEAKKSGKVFDPKTKKWVNKEDLKDGGSDDNQEDKNGKKKSSNASVEDQTAIDDALKNGTQANAIIPNAQSGEQDFMSKYEEAFKLENCIQVSKR